MYPKARSKRMNGFHPGGRYRLPNGEHVRAVVHLVPETETGDHLYVVACDGVIMRFGSGGATADDATPAGEMYVYPAARANTALTADDLVPDPEPDR
jgi:hypothetical protein